MRTITRSTCRILSSIAITMLLAGFANAADAADWTISRTVDGQPDLQGVWINPTLTPMERPRSQSEKKFLSDDEITEAVIADALT